MSVLIHSNEQDFYFRSLQKKKKIIPEKALVKRQHKIVNPTAFFVKDLSKSRTKKWRLDKTLMTGIQENKQICLKMKNPEPVKEDGWPDRLLLSRYKKRRNSIRCRSGKGFSGNSVVQGAGQVMGIEAYSVNLESFGFPGRNRNVFGKPDLLCRAGHREAYYHCRTGSQAGWSIPPSPAPSASQ